MKFVFKIILYIIIAVVAILIIGFSYFLIAFPKVDAAENIKVEVTPERVERGKYLFNNVSLCVDCHTPRDWSKFSAPPDESKYASGNVDDFTNKASGLPGDFYAANLTPTNLKTWTDGEILRAVTSGINKDGKPLFPIMPYLNYGKMSKEDIFSIIAYIRTLNPIESKIPPSEPKFPMGLIMKMMPKQAEFREIPDKSNRIKYGEYMITSAACSDCHTPLEKGQPVFDLAFSGNREFMIPTGGTVRSANISSDVNTGIGSWSKEHFVAKFKKYADSNFVFENINQNDFNTIMPWKKYSGMTEDDLGAIYDYLMTTKPVSKRVLRFTPSN